MLAEFLGTMVLILFGDGVVAMVQLFGHGIPGEIVNGGYTNITLAWGLGVTMGIYVAGRITGAHLNPAVTFGFAVSGGDYSKMVPYIAAQLLGAFVGAVLVWIFFWPHWKETPDPAAKLGVFCTAPAIRMTLANLACEIIATFLLVFLVGALTSKAVATTSGLAGGMTGYLVGAIVWAIGLSLGGTTGYAINPARDLAPRTAHALLPIAGKGSSDWRYAPVPVFGPLIGGGLAGLLIRCLHF